MPSDQDLFKGMYQVPVGVAVRTGALSPEELAQKYEGGGLQQPLIDPIDLLAGAAGAKIARGGYAAYRTMKEAKAAEHVATMVDPADPLGTTRHLLRDWSWNPTQMFTKEEHGALEKAAGWTRTKTGEIVKLAGDPKAERTLHQFENNMHRMSSFHKARAAFEEMEPILGKTRSAYYNARWSELGAKIGDVAQASVTEAKPIPTSVVKDLKKLLQEYEKDLVHAGVQGPITPTGPGFE